MLSRYQLTPSIVANSISDQRVDLKELKGKKVLIKFHRFSGCPVCQSDIQEFIARQNELNALGIETIIFMHSSKEKIKSNFKEVPGLNIVADREKVYYAIFDSQFSWSNLFSIRSWRATFVSIFKGYFPHFNKFEGGVIGVPSDFLINEKGTIVSLNYGKHFGDSWSVSDVLGIISKL